MGTKSTAIDPRNPAVCLLAAAGIALSGLAAPVPALHLLGPLAMLAVISAAVVYTWFAEGAERGREAFGIATGILTAPVRAPLMVGRVAWRYRRPQRAERESHEVHRLAGHRAVFRRACRARAWHRPRPHRSQARSGSDDGSGSSGDSESDPPSPARLAGRALSIQLESLMEAAPVMGRVGA